MSEDYVTRGELNTAVKDLQPDVTKAHLNAVLQKVGALENKMNSLSTSGTPDQMIAVREMINEIPEEFVINARIVDEDGNVTKERKEVTLKLAHPSFYKLELIADEIGEITKEVSKDLQSDMAIPAFVMKLIANKKAQESLYKVFQIAFDPLPDPARDELSIPISHIKCLDPAKVIDVLVKRATPFFITMLQTFQLGRTTPQSPDI